MKFSKKDKLFLANSLFFLFLLFYLFYNWFLVGDYPVNTAFYYVLIQCLFSFCSLLIYHGSRVIHAVTKKNARQVEDSAVTRREDAPSEEKQSERDGSEKVSLHSYVIVGIVAVCLVAFLVCLVFFKYYYKP